jgi:hypothetical protein
LFEEDATHFHQSCKTACDKHNPGFIKIKNNVMPISGTRIAMKRAE